MFHFSISWPITFDTYFPLLSYSSKPSCDQGKSLFRYQDSTLIFSENILEYAAMNVKSTVGIPHMLKISANEFIDIALKKKKNLSKLFDSHLRAKKTQGEWVAYSLEFLLYALLLALLWNVFFTEFLQLLLLLFHTEIFNLSKMEKLFQCLPFVFRLPLQLYYSTNRPTPSNEIHNHTLLSCRKERKNYFQRRGVHFQDILCDIVTRKYHIIMSVYLK